MRYSVCIILFSLCYLQSCGQKDSKANVNEDFVMFLSDFSNSPDFQKQRLSDKFVECEVTNEGDSSCKNIQSTSWKHLTLVNTNSFQTIYDNFDLKRKNTDERVFAIERTEGGSSSYYYFKRIDGKWFFVKRVIYL